ncbi:MAG: MFS transporter [Reyranella sp.]|uniref:MFS transporter n=1 Tax=Reyranella sp. TaxID=1929291 RepID=UPI0012188CA4|nr:MFS transporter [Reyranella sp.]TAJ42184.1 MAG: MFS transporter [Reyranella sp.]
MSVATPALPVRAERLWAALLAATLMNLPLGSVYSFSVLLRPIEQELAIPRSALSLVFGLCTVGFTVGSVGAAFLYRVAPAPVLVLASALVAAGGIAMAATASGLTQLLLGYGVVFGTGGGVTYILLQQGVNMLVRRRQGLVNGYIVSLYPLGAMIATPLFHACNEAYGWRTTLWGLAAVLVACGIAAALLARHGGARLVAPAATGSTTTGPATGPAILGPTFYKLSATFFLAASAGLMVLSQAREIVAAYGGAAALAVAATTGITGAIAAARISGGWLVDRFAVPYVMCAAHGLALGGGLLLTLLPSPLTAFVGLGMIGLGYGFVSGATAGGIGLYWRPADYGRVAGRTYVAWCLAAVSLPVLAGYLFDITREYSTAVLIAAGANIAGMAMALTMPRRGWREGG